MARLRFTNRFRVCDKVTLPVEFFSSNGEQCLNWLCQARGQAQTVSMICSRGTMRPALRKSSSRRLYSVRLRAKEAIIGKKVKMKKPITAGATKR